MTFRVLRTAACAGALACALLGASPHSNLEVLAGARIIASSLPYLPGSAIPLQIDGAQLPFSFDVLGDASVHDAMLRIAKNPTGRSATVIASTQAALGVHRFEIAEPPRPDQSFIAVASYDTGVILHEAQAPFRAEAVLGIGGAPADVAIDGNARLAAADTAGDSLTLAGMQPWNVASIAGVPLTDELEFDRRTHQLFATNRDINGSGAITRVSPDGTVSRKLLGETSEGIAIDQQRSRVYVANTNDGTVSVVDERTMNEEQRFHAVDRVFSLALSADGTRLYAVSNQSFSSPFAAAGGVVTLDVGANRPRVIRRSAHLAFPIGVALDEPHHRLFVTDEHDNAIDVLDTATLKPLHAPLQTCRTPWKPAIDARTSTLYVPCAQADRIDAFDTRTLRRIPGAPFATGGYPLAVAVWHPAASVVR